MLQQIIDRYKRLRTDNFLRQTCSHQYAFVGMGQHSLTNLYPVLHYLGVPLKYICVTNEDKARLIQQKYPAVIATTSLDDILGDPDVSAVFVAASPAAHFTLAQQVLAAGKALFIEKPPCTNLEELSILMSQEDTQPSTLNSQPSTLVGLQKRYAPAVQILKKRLKKTSGETYYTLRYCTGAYPEGDALTDLYIHPLDLASHLFGPATVVSARCVADSTLLLMLEHKGQGTTVNGQLELSTAHTWTSARETLTVNTPRGIYRLRQTEALTYAPKPATLLGIPMEKVRPTAPTVEVLFRRNNFTPTLPNNQIHTQGYYDELLTFVNLVEGRRATNLTPLSSLIDTYTLMDAVRKASSPHIQHP